MVIHSRIHSVAKYYVTINRDQLFLLPPSMTDWLPEDHLVWFVIDLLHFVDTTAFHERYANGGPGRPAYDPDMMLALLIYAYCNGVRSSRKIQRLCSTDIAYRVLCAEQIPDHATIAQFRAAQQDAFKNVFVEVLRLCAKAGLASLGTVAIDGTKIGANAARRANREAHAIEAEVERILREAETTDSSEKTHLFGTTSANSLPPNLARRSSRLARLRAAQAELKARQTAAEAEAAEAADKAQAEAAKGRKRRGRKPTQTPRAALARAKADVEVARQRAAARAARRARAEAEGRQLGGRPIEPNSKRERELPEAEARLKVAEMAVEKMDRTARVNVTDPDSRVMSTTCGLIQGYNAQAAVNLHQIVLASAVTREETDYHQLLPMIAATQRMAEVVGIDDELGQVLADAGYWSDENATAEGPDRLIATQKDHKQRQAAREMGVCIGPPPEGSSSHEAMEHRLRTAEGAAAYAMRSQTVEPTFGDIKENRGGRRFMRRGLAAAESEWSLMCTIHNARKLFDLLGRPGLARLAVAIT